jgi:Fic family protein
VIAVPPAERLPNPFKTIAKACPEQLDNYLALFFPTDEQGRYLHYDDIRFRLPKGLDIDLAWSVIKLARQRQLNTLIQLGEPAQDCVFFLTPTIQKVISETDRNTTDAALAWMLSQMGEPEHIEYLVNDLIQDEAIGSSQMEGAATTTQVAKDIIRKNRQPRTPDERMILGNFKMMNFAWQNKDEDLSIDLLLKLHQVGVEGIQDDKYYPGQFRDSDDVVVVDAKGRTLHTPPPVKGLKKRLKALVKWTNDSHHGIDSNQYIHPLIKAVTLHFAIGYEHPFRDGNGRVARALFYWYLFKTGFSAFRYIAISVLLKKAPAKYGKSYLQTETDSMDLTYFIEYQCKTILRAITAFKTAYKEAVEDIEAFNQWLWKSGLYKQLSERQRIVFQVAKSGATPYFTALNVQDNFGCSYNTAAKVLNGLVDLKLFQKEKQGKQWVFSILSPDKIKKNWKR